MAKLTVFNFLTLNGYYKGENGDISWHRHGGEEGEYSADSLAGNNILIFGKVTFELMAGYWPSEMATANDPLVAKGMNDADKIVFSKTLRKSDWKNTRIINEDAVKSLKALKAKSDRDMTILGSGSLIGPLAEAGLIDGFEFMIDPVTIPAGTSIFYNTKHKIDLKLINSRQFSSGVVLLSFEPLR
jgi:dihydrofolate reductase